MTFIKKLDSEEDTRVGAGTKLPEDFGAQSTSWIRDSQLGVSELCRFWSYTKSFQFFPKFLKTKKNATKSRQPKSPYQFGIFES